MAKLNNTKINNFIWTVQQKIYYDKYIVIWVNDPQNWFFLGLCPPNKKSEGNQWICYCVFLFTADLRSIQRGYASVSPRKHSPVLDSPRPPAPRDDLIKPPPEQKNVFGDPTYARGGHGIFGMPKVMEPLTLSKRFLNQGIIHKVWYNSHDFPGVTGYYFEKSTRSVCPLLPCFQFITLTGLDKQKFSAYRCKYFPTHQL